MLQVVLVTAKYHLQSMSKVKHQERYTRQEAMNKDMCSKRSYKVLAISEVNVTENFIIKIMASELLGLMN